MGNASVMNYLYQLHDRQETDAEWFSKEMMYCLRRVEALIEVGNHEKAMAEMKSLATEILGAV